MVKRNNGGAEHGRKMRNISVSKCNSKKYHAYKVNKDVKCIWMPSEGEEIRKSKLSKNYWVSVLKNKENRWTKQVSNKEKMHISKYSEKKSCFNDKIRYIVH